MTVQAWGETVVLSQLACLPDKVQGGGGGGFEALLIGSASAAGPKQLKGLNLRKGGQGKPPAQANPSSYAASPDTSDSVELSGGKGEDEAAAKKFSNLAVSAANAHMEDSEQLPAAVAISPDGDPGAAQKNSRPERHTAGHEGAPAARITSGSQAGAPQESDHLSESALKLASKPAAGAYQSPVQSQANALQNGATSIRAVPQSPAGNTTGLHPANSNADNPGEKNGLVSRAEVAAQPPLAEEEAATKGLPQREAQKGHARLSLGDSAAARAQGHESIAGGANDKLAGEGKAAIGLKHLDTEEGNAVSHNDELKHAGADVANGARSGVQNARAFWEALGEEPAQRTDDPGRRPRRRLSKSPGSFSGSDGGSQSRPTSAAASVASRSCSESGHSRPGSAGATNSLLNSDTGTGGGLPSSPQADIERVSGANATSDSGKRGGLQGSPQADVEGVPGATALPAQAREEKGEQHERSSGDPTAAPNHASAGDSELRRKEDQRDRSLMDPTTATDASAGGSEPRREEDCAASRSVGTALEGHAQSSKPKREEDGEQSTNAGTALEGHSHRSAAQLPAAGAQEETGADENMPTALMSAASAELPVSTMPSSSTIHPDMYPSCDSSQTKATTALSPREAQTYSSAAGAGDTDACRALSAAGLGKRTNAQAVEVSSDPQPGSQADPGGAEPGSRQEASKSSSAISMHPGDANRLGDAVHEARESVGTPEELLPSGHIFAEQGSQASTQAGRVGSSSSSLVDENAQQAGVVAEMPDALSGPILEAFNESKPDLGQKHSMSAEGLLSVSSSSAPHANTESTEVVERSEIGSVIDSEMAEASTKSLRLVADDVMEDRQQPAGVAAESSASLTELRRATPAGETSGAVGEHDAAWAKRKKHMFVLSNAGKPIFTLHGDGNELAGFMAVIHAMLSFASERGDPLHSLRAGKHQVVFLVKGPLYLVAVSAQGEPAGVLRLQLETLHAQIVCILTTGFERMFARNPRYDSRRLLGGTDSVLRGLIEGFDSDPSALLGAFPPLPTSPSVRHSCLLSLQAAVKASEALYGVILVRDLVLGLAQPRAHPFAPTNLLLLSNFVRTTSVGVAESFTPMCLPHFNPSAFLHAYIHYLNRDAEVCLILLASEQDAFYRLAEAGHTLAKELTSSSILQEVAKAASAEGKGRISISDLPQSAGGGAPGSTPLLHFLYKSPARGQFIMPAFTGPLTDNGFRKGVMAAYARVHSAMFAEPITAQGTMHATQRIHFAQDDFCTVMAFVGSEYELFAAFDALAEKPRALEICQQLCAWVKKSQATLFMPL